VDSVASVAKVFDLLTFCPIPIFWLNRFGKKLTMSGQPKLAQESSWKVEVVKNQEKR